LCILYFTGIHRDKKRSRRCYKIGVTGPIRKNNENWKLELYTGIGVSFFDFQENGIPPGASFIRPPTHEDGLGTMDEDEPNIMIPFGLIITYRINSITNYRLWSHEKEST
jgi:hypothetical protein